MYTSYDTPLGTLHAFANELSNQLQSGIRWYEALELFEVRPIEDGMRTYSVTSYDVEQPIFVCEGGLIPDIVKKYMPLESYDVDEENYDNTEWLSYIASTYIETAYIGFHILPGGYDTVKVVPYVDYRHIDSEAYAEGSPKFLTLEQIRKEPARYVGTLELMLAQL